MNFVKIFRNIEPSKRDEFLAKSETKQLIYEAFKGSPLAKSYFMEFYGAENAAKYLKAVQAEYTPPSQILNFWNAFLTKIVEICQSFSYSAPRGLVITSPAFNSSINNTAGNDNSVGLSGDRQLPKFNQ